MQPAAAPCMTGAVNFKTMKLSMSACCMHAATSLNLQEWVCLLDGWTPWTDSTSPPPTYAPWPQELNLFCETRFFVSVFKMNSASFVALSELVLRTLLTSSKPPTRREDDKEGMQDKRVGWTMNKFCRRQATLLRHRTPSILFAAPSVAKLTGPQSRV